MKLIVKALWTEPVLFLSAVASVFTVGGSVAVALGADPWIAVVCGVIGPAVSAAARAKAWSPKSVAATAHDSIVKRRHRLPLSPERPE